MSAPREAYLHGAALSIGWADARKSLTDLIFECVSAALADAGARMAQVDSVVLSAHDLIDGRSLSSMVTAPAAGAYLRDEIRLSEDGLASASLAAARVAAGESELSVVAAWGRASEGGFPWMTRHSMDPFLEQPLGLTDLDVSAFRLSRWLSRHPGGEARAAAALARRARAARNPRALREGGIALAPARPLDAGESAPLADVFAAAIVGARPGPARLAGIGHGTDAPAIGARDLLAMPALAAAARGALAGAGRGLGDIDVFEIDGLTLADEALALEALGLAAPGAGFRLYADSDRVNASGGGAAGWCYPAMGLVRLIEAFDRLRSGAARRALATGLGANGAQTATAIVLEAA